jgi:hypothetical protein
MKKCVKTLIGRSAILGVAILVTQMTVSTATAAVNLKSLKSLALTADEASFLSATALASANAATITCAPGYKAYCCPKHTLKCYLVGTQPKPCKDIPPGDCHP